MLIFGLVVLAGCSADEEITTSAEDIGSGESEFIEAATPSGVVDQADDEEEEEERSAR